MAARSLTTNLEHSIGEDTKSSADVCNEISASSTNCEICQICQEPISNKRYLSCDHALCGAPKNCLLTLITSVSSSGSNWPKCPVCRADIFPDSQSRDSQLMGSRSLRRRSTGISLGVNFEDDDDAACDEHYKQKEIFCKCCQIVICPDCWRESHGGHEIEHYKNVKERRINALTPQLEACITLCKQVSDIWIDFKENFSTRAGEIKISQLNELVRNASQQKFEKELELLYSKLEKQKSSFDTTIEIVEKLSAEMKRSNAEIVQGLTLLKKDMKKVQPNGEVNPEVSILRSGSIGGLNLADKGFRFEEVHNLLDIGFDPTHITEALVDSTGIIFCRAEQRDYADVKAPLIKLTQHNDNLRIEQTCDYEITPTGFCRLRKLKLIFYNIAASNQFLYGLFRCPKQKRYVIQILDKESLRFRRPLTVDLLRLDMTTLWSIAGWGRHLIIVESHHGKCLSIVILKNEIFIARLNMDKRYLLTRDYKLFRNTLFIFDDRNNLVLFNLETQKFKNVKLAELSEGKKTLVIGQSFDGKLALISKAENGLSPIQLYILEPTFEQIENRSEIDLAHSEFIHEDNAANVEISLLTMLDRERILISVRDKATGKVGLQTVRIVVE